MRALDAVPSIFRTAGETAMTVRYLPLKALVAALAILLAVASRSDEQAKSEKASQMREDNGLSR